MTLNNVEIRITIELLNSHKVAAPLQKEELLFDVDREGELDGGWEGDIVTVLGEWFDGSEYTEEG
jgi:hypothetical protein